VNIDFPFHFDAKGRTASTNLEDHVRDMIEQLLFTNPGERVNRPEFGSGLKQLVFAPNSLELGAALQFSVQAALERYLGDVISLENVEATVQDAELYLEVSYRLRQTNEPQTARFVRAV
jgi:phage baseplate assembly protein W